MVCIKSSSRLSLSEKFEDYGANEFMIIFCKIIPNAKQNKVIELTSESFKVYVTAPAREGRANKALINLLADFFEVPKTKIQILKGEKGRKKEVWIDD